MFSKHRLGPFCQPLPSVQQTTSATRSNPELLDRGDPLVHEGKRTEAIGQFGAAVGAAYSQAILPTGDRQPAGIASIPCGPGRHNIDGGDEDASGERFRRQQAVEPPMIGGRPGGGMWS